VSKTLEYAYDDWCIARFAEGAGRAELAAEYDRRSQAWRHLLDPETGFMRARRNQRWVAPFDPRRVDNNYTEANAWQYSLFVPHDVEGLAAALGGAEALVERLDALFEADSATLGREQADITGMIGQYAHGNEPSHHMAWLYHHAGRPGAGAPRIRRILDELYAPRPDGLSGNEDCGQMSAWYVLSALGLYPVTPCSDEYLVGVPIFRGAELRLESGARFAVRTRGRKPGPGTFVAAAVLDGEPLERSFLHHREISAGGELVLTLAERPGESWGRAPSSRPTSRVEGPVVPAAPFVRADGDRFRDRLRVELAAADPSARILYTFDPATPSEDWSVYEGPFEVRESTTVHLVAERDGARSPVVASRLHRIPNDWIVELAAEPSPQYRAGGVLSLIDGLRAPTAWRIGGWMGFRPDDLVATIDLGSVRGVRRAGGSFLQEQRSWIWLPREVTVSVSLDGKRFVEAGRATHDVPPDTEEAVRRDLVADFAGEKEARYVRIEATSLGTIPAWHLGAGEPAWIFVDELIVE
jgi:hypothetical protein